MDILKEIETQIDLIKKEGSSVYLDEIFIHLDRAEIYYKQGKTDQHYFNDVIYRSNQAYEGALKEAYKVLAAKTDEELSKTSPYKIENHFRDNSIFKDRVLQLFENYRQEWRNKSTHDYKLFFDENEAFIALTNVSSFVHLLLKQIQERMAYKHEQERLQQDNVAIQDIRRIAEAPDENLSVRVVKLLEDFSVRNEHVINVPVLLEIELLGMLHGFLSQASEDFIIDREPKLEVEQEFLRPDFVIKNDDERIVLEVKRSVQISVIQSARIRGYIDQMLRFLQAADVSDGIIYFAKTVHGAFAVSHNKHEVELDGKTYNIYVVTT